jgi:DNA replication and repair protein RecF
MTGITPLLLLDEIVAHLDPKRRIALFDELKRLGAQVWMTGADPAAFIDVGADAEIFDVADGRIGPRAG